MKLLKLLVTVAAIGAWPSAADAQTTTFYACIGAKGAMRLVSADASCVKGEFRIEWNNPGPQGPQGPQGDTGAPGPAGTTGQGVQFNAPSLGSGLVLPESNTFVPAATYDVAGGADTFYLISYGAIFANPAEQCIGQMALFIDGTFVIDGIATVVSAQPGCTLCYGWANTSGTWILNDGLPHQIQLFGRQIDCAPNSLQMIRPYLGVSAFKK